MHAKLTSVVIACGLVLMAAWTGDAPAEEAQAAVNFQDQVAGIFRSRCNSCHNADQQKGGLNLETYGAAMQGGSSGEVVEPGDPANSTLWLLVNHEEEPTMPPNASKLPDEELEVIRQWIEVGAPETAGSVVAKKARPTFDFQLDPEALGRPDGPPAMPEGLSTEPYVVSDRANAITALAASPWAPVVAVAGHKQVLLYHTDTHRLIGVLPFPEGVIFALKFSRNGDLLLAGGGRGGHSGLAVVWDVRTGERLFEIGREYDVVLAADISPDHSQVALGGPARVVRVYDTADGEPMFEMRKHTEWITALEFSPDGVLLATGDRNNGLVVWEAHSGREFHDLKGHDAAITDLTWRLDSNVLGSASDDGSIRLWEMENGRQIKNWEAHGGVASLRFAKDGRLVSTGRDRTARLWDQDGQEQHAFEAFDDLALEAVFDPEETKVIAGDWTGEVRVWNVEDGARLADLSANPDPVATRLEQARAGAASARDDADQGARELAALEAEAASAAQTMAELQAKLEEATAAQVEADQAVAEKQADVEAARARADSLKAEADALAAELADRDTTTAAANP